MIAKCGLWGAASGLLVLLSGCCHCGPSVGWRFEVGKPATVSSNALVQQLSGPVTGIPVGSTFPPLMHDQTIVQTPARFASAPCSPDGPLTPRSSLGARGAGAPENCTLEDVCRILNRLEARMAGQERLPMPKGGAGPE